MTATSKHRALPYLLTAAGMAVILGTLYALCGYWPFGPNSVMTGDLNSQYIPFYAHFYEAVRTGGSLTYAGDMGLGGGSFALFAYYFASPFAWLYLLFAPETYGWLCCVVWALKVLLAALFLNEGHFLLIDEPTNHLDAKARAMVSAYLQKKQGFILVSHDRRFLDGCVDHILSLNRAGIEVQSGNFSSWFANFQQRQALEEAQDQRLRKDIKRLEQSARRTALWSDRVEASKKGAADKGYVGHKAAKMMKRAKTIEARQQKAIEEKSALLKNAETAEDLRVTPLLHYADPLVLFQDVEIRYGGRTVCGPLTFAVRQGERVALDGGNGAGKSSLLKLLCGQDIPHAGQVRRAPGLVVSYVPQDAAGLAGDLTGFARAHGLDESLFKAILRKMDFSRVQFEKDMASFSSGQKKKVLLARSLCEKAHLYVWDEPLNFIDIYTRMQIEKLIGASAPSMLFVEHDAAFRQAVATGTVRL